METISFEIRSELGFRYVTGTFTGKTWVVHFHENNSDGTISFRHYDAFTEQKSAVEAARAWALGTGH